MDEDFERWWLSYPKKATGKGQARERWRKMTVADRKDAFAGLVRHNGWWAEHETDLAFIPAGNVWLNQRRWEDDQPRSAVQLKAVLPLTQMDRVRARMDARKTETKADAR